jgi:phage-related tail protein
MAELKEVSITYSGSVKCDLPQLPGGAKSYESVTGFFSFGETYSVNPEEEDTDELRKVTMDKLMSDVDDRVEKFYAENSRFAKE